VREEVEQNLLEPVGLVGDELGCLCHHFVGQVDLSPVGSEVEHLDDVGHDLPDAHGDEAHLEHLVLDLGVVQDVVDEVGQQVRAVQRWLHVLPLQLLGDTTVLVGALDHGDSPIEWGAEFVGNGGEEQVLVLVDVLEEHDLLLVGEVAADECDGVLLEEIAELDGECVVLPLLLALLLGHEVERPMDLLLGCVIVFLFGI